MNTFSTSHIRHSLLALMTLFALAIACALPAHAAEVSTVLTPGGVNPGGRAYLGTVHLDSPAPAGGVTVLLGCETENGAVSTLANPHLFGAPNIHQVFINTGGTSATFTMDTVGVSNTVQVFISGRVGNGVKRRAPLTLRRAKVTGIQFSKNPVGMNSSCTVTAFLDGDAPLNGGITIAFASSNTGVAVPVTARVTISGNASVNDRAKTTISTKLILWDTDVTISATDTSANTVSDTLHVKLIVF